MYKEANFLVINLSQDKKKGWKGEDYEVFAEEHIDLRALQYSSVQVHMLTSIHSKFKGTRAQTFGSESTYLKL